MHGKILVKSNERCEYSYIGLAGFVFRKMSYDLLTLNLIFRGLTYDSFSSLVHFHC